MRIIINVKCKDGGVALESKLDHGNKYTPDETRAGEWLYGYIDMLLKKMQESGAKAVKRENVWWRRKIKAWKLRRIKKECGQ